MINVRVSETTDDTVCKAIDDALAALKVARAEVLNLVAEKNTLRTERDHFRAGRTEAQAKLALIMGAVNDAALAPLVEGGAA